MLLHQKSRLYSNFGRMSKIDKLKEKYIADTEMMASKSRFGYFSLLPSHTAAITQESAPAPHRQPDGKVHTEPRNIYPGTTSTGSLKKNYFSYTPSAFHGTPFQDPGKAERKLELEQSKKWKGKDIYKPASLNKTTVKAAYEYMSDNDPSKQKKTLRDSSGKVITQSANMLISPQSKIDFNKNKEFKYVECPVKKEEKKKEVKEEHQEEAFKIGSPHKDLFTSNTQAYFDANIKKPETGKKALNLTISHDTPFKPSCISPGKNFTPIVYKEEGQGKQEVKVVKKENKAHQQPFKLIKMQHNSKPTPSISLSKTNLLRGYR